MVEQERIYFKAFENLAIPTVIVEEDMTISAANKAFAALSGYSRKEIEGDKRWSEFVVQEDLVLMKEYYRRRREGLDSPGEYEFRFRDRHGDVKDILATVGVIPGSGKSVASMLDMTPLKEGEAALAESEKRYRMLVETMRDGLGIRDENDLLTQVNDRFCEILGFSKEEIIGRSVSSFLDQEDLEIYQENLKRREKGEDSSYEMAWTAKDGRKVPTIISPRAIFGESGEFRGSLAVITDVGELKRTKNALKHEQDQFLSILDSLDLSVYISDPFTYEILYANPCLSRHFDEDLVGGLCYRELQDRDSPCPFCTNEIILNNGGRPYRWEFHNPVINVDAIVIDRMIRWRDGRAVRLEVCVDVTELRKTQGALRSSEETARAIIEASMDSAILMDQEGVILALNRTAAERLHKSKDDLIGRCAFELFSSELAESRKRELEKAARSGKPARFRDTRAGTVFDNTLYPVYDSDGKVKRIALFARDVTQEQETERMLRENEKRFRTLADYASAWEYWIDPDMNFVYNSPSCERMSGYPPEEFLKDSGLFLKIIHPEDLPLVAEHFRKGPVSKDEAHSIEFRIITRYGEVCWIEHICHDMYGGDGEWLGRRCSNRDITRRMKARDELERYAQRLESLRDIDCAIMEVLSPEELSHAALERIRKSVACRRASVCLYDSELHTGTVIAVQGEEDIHASNTEPFSLISFKGAMDVLRSGEVYATRKPSMLQFVGVVCREKGFREDAPFIGVPLLFHGELTGSLNFLRDGPEGFSQEQIEIATEVARHLAVALENARMFRSASEQRELMRSLALRLENIEEGERRRLALELHDQVGANLAILGINLNLIGVFLESGKADRVFNRLDVCSEVVKEITHNIRNAMADLRPPLLDDYGLVAAIRWYGELFRERTNLTVEVKGEDLVPRLPTSVETSLFRIAQEALANISKHARAKRVKVEVWADGGTIRMTIADDGVGFNPLKRGGGENEPGWGLLTMRERANAIGAQLYVESEAGKGTRIVVELRR